MDYLKKVYPNGYVGESMPQDTLLKTDFVSLTDGDTTHFKALLQAKIFNGKRKKKYLLISEYKMDQQCEWYIERFYSIKNDSLLVENLKDYIEPLGMDRFLDTAGTNRTILAKYRDSIQKYVGSEDFYNRFYEEYYDLRFSIYPDGRLACSLLVCDYITRNIYPFEEEDELKLKNTKTLVYRFDSKKGKFLVYKGHWDF